jgi:predicted nicotinamide N-methyase
MTIASLAQPLKLVLSDGDPLAMDLLSRNLQDDYNLERMQKTSESIFMHTLSWGQQVPSSFVEYCYTNNVWNKDEDDPVFDTIVAGDVLYKEELPQLFFETVHALLSSKGSLWLCHVPRSTVTHAIVTTAATLANFSWTVIAIPRVPLLHTDDMDRAKIYRMTRRIEQIE